jgi:hypothetical protein
MSNEGFKNVPGVPDGWELLALRRPQIGEYVMDGYGNPCRITAITGEVLAIIRKIEKPKQYRPFANADEFKPHRDRWVKVVSEDNNCGCQLDEGDIGGERKIDGYNEHSVCIWEGWLTYGDAFKCFVFDDGTPFGVEVTE